MVCLTVKKRFIRLPFKTWGKGEGPFCLSFSASAFVIVFVGLLKERSHFARDLESGNVQYCPPSPFTRSAERGKWPIRDLFPLNFIFRIEDSFNVICFDQSPNLINPFIRLAEIDRINSDRATDSIVKWHI